MGAFYGADGSSGIVFDGCGHVHTFLTYSGGSVVSTRSELQFRRGNVVLDSTFYDDSGERPLPVLWTKWYLKGGITSPTDALPLLSALFIDGVPSNPFYGVAIGSHGVDGGGPFILVGALTTGNPADDGEYGIGLTFGNANL